MELLKLSDYFGIDVDILLRQDLTNKTEAEIVDISKRLNKTFEVNVLKREIYQLHERVNQLTLERDLYKDQLKSKDQKISSLHSLIQTLARNLYQSDVILSQEFGLVNVKMIFFDLCS